MATLNVDVKANGSLWDRVIRRMKSDMKSFRAIAPKLAAVGAGAAGATGGLNLLRQTERAKEHERAASRLDITGSQFGELANLQAFRPLVGSGITDTASQLGELKHRATKQFDTNAIETLSKISPDWRGMNEAQLMSTALERFPEMGAFNQGRIAAELPAFRDANFRSIDSAAIDRAAAIGMQPDMIEAQGNRLASRLAIDRGKAVLDRTGRDIAGAVGTQGVNLPGGRNASGAPIPGRIKIDLTDGTIDRLGDKINGRQDLPGDEVN